MSSSTSSSRKPFAKTLVAILLAMSASLALVHLFTWANDASAETIITRVMEARSNLPKIVQTEGEIVIAFGSSMTEAGFSARQFDRQLAERGIDITSYNFGFGGLNPYFQDFVSRRIRDEFVANDRRLKLALVEFTPLQNTKARYQGALPTIDSYVSMLATGDEIWELAKEDPTLGARVANIHYLRNDISAEMITFYFGRQIFGGGRPRSDLPEDEEAQATLEELGPILTKAFEEDYPDYVDSDWSWEWQGSGTIPEERSAETLELFPKYYAARRNEKAMTDDRLNRINCCDLEELDFEEELIAAFIRTVQNFQEFSDNVEVILMPVNEDWIKRPAEGQRRLREALERVALETGVSIRNFEQAPEITPQMFSDTTHLARYSGDVRFTELLVDTYEPTLRD